MTIPSKEQLSEAARVLRTKGSKPSEQREAGKVLAASGGGQKGGLTRARNLSAEERSAIARMGGLARQAKQRAEREVREAQAKLDKLKKKKTAK